MGTYTLQLGAERHSVIVAHDGTVVLPEGLTLPDGTYTLHDAEGHATLEFDMKANEPSEARRHTLGKIQIGADDTVILPPGMELPDGTFDLLSNGMVIGRVTVEGGVIGKLERPLRVVIPRLVLRLGLGAVRRFSGGRVSAETLLRGFLPERDPFAGEDFTVGATSGFSGLEAVSHIEDSIACLEGRPQSCGHIHPPTYSPGQNAAWFAEHILAEIADERSSNFGTFLENLRVGPDANLAYYGISRRDVERFIERRERALAWQPSATG